jgi:CRISPR-associated endonuclease/helicase Cas3
LSEAGEVVVFVQDIPVPLAQVRKGAEATRSTLAAGTTDPLAPAAFERYFRLYYAGINGDRHGIVDDLRNRGDFAIDFRTAADKFKLVDDANQATVIVPYQSQASGATDVAMLIAKLQQNKEGQADRWVLCKLQRYTVSVRKNVLDLWQARGDVTETMLPGLYLLKDVLRYDACLGLLPEGNQPSAAQFVS